MEESIRTFFEHWIQEFAQAVEMFNGERPTLTEKEAEKSQLDEWEIKRSQFHWWQQESAEPQKFKAWVGAEEASWMALGGSGDATESKETYQEVVGQANQGAAAVLSSAFPSPVKFGAGAANAPGPLQALRVARVSVTFKGAELPPLIVALEPEAAKILDGPEDTPQATVAPAKGAAAASETNVSVNSIMLDRLMDLQLPVSVLLGQTVLPIRDCLKINSGSLIELDRQLGDYVEVMIHGTVVARGEIVSVKGNYGVRIKEVISRKDRFALKDAA